MVDLGTNMSTMVVVYLAPTLSFNFPIRDPPIPEALKQLPTATPRPPDLNFQ